MKSLVILPTYNEAENIEAILDQLRPLDVEVLVVDDNSPDGTAEIVARFQAHHPGCHLLLRQEKQGLGPAYIAGFAWALGRGYERIVEMDADGSHPIERLPAMLAASDDAGLVIGSRYIHGGAVRDWPRRRVALSRWGNRYVRIMLGLRVHDCTAGYRVFTAETLRRIDFAAIATSGYGFQIDTTRRAAEAGVKISEIPITFTDRVRGQSKMSMAIVVEALVATTRWGLQRLWQALSGRATV